LSLSITGTYTLAEGPHDEFREWKFQILYEDLSTVAAPAVLVGVVEFRGVSQGTSLGTFDIMSRGS